MQITLKAARINAGLLLEDVGKLVGRDKVTVGRWERGLSDITLRQFNRLCRIYGVDPVDVVVPERPRPPQRPE